MTRWVGFPSPRAMHRRHRLWALRHRPLGVVTLLLTELYDGRGIALYGCRCCSWTACAVEPRS